MDMGHATWASEVGGSCPTGKFFLFLCMRDVDARVFFEISARRGAARRAFPFPYAK